MHSCDGGNCPTRLESVFFRGENTIFIIKTKTKINYFRSLGSVLLPPIETLLHFQKATGTIAAVCVGGGDFSNGIMTTQSPDKNTHNCSSNNKYPRKSNKSSGEKGEKHVCVGGGKQSRICGCIPVSERRALPLLKNLTLPAPEGKNQTPSDQLDREQTRCGAKLSMAPAFVTIILRASHSHGKISVPAVGNRGGEKESTHPNLHPDPREQSADALNPHPPYFPFPTADGRWCCMPN